MTDPKIRNSRFAIRNPKFAISAPVWAVKIIDSKAFMQYLFAEPMAFKQDTSKRVLNQTGRLGLQSGRVAKPRFRVCSHRVGAESHQSPF